MSTYEIRRDPRRPSERVALQPWRLQRADSATEWILLSTHTSLKAAIRAMDADARKRRPAQVGELIDGVVRLMVRA